MHFRETPYLGIPSFSSIFIMSNKEPIQTGLELRKPDAQGRIVIGKEHADETYSVEKLDNGDILLRPVVVIHKNEAWLYSNPEALASVRRGLQQISEGKSTDLGSFAHYVDSEE
jgi:hypothetical protein